MVRGEVDKGFDEFWCIGMICKTKGGGADKVYEGIQGRFVVTVIRCALLGGEEGKDSSDIRAGQYGQPVNGTGDGVVVGLAFG